METPGTTQQVDEDFGHVSAFLMRFGQRVHLEAFRRGQLYMNPAEYYAKLEGDHLRSDDLEGVDEIHQPSAVKSFVIGGLPGREPIDLAPRLAGPIKFWHRRERRNLFCLYLAPLKVGLLDIDPRCEEFGDSFVAVLDGSTFVDRFHAAASAAGGDLAAITTPVLDLAAIGTRMEINIG